MRRVSTGLSVFALAAMVGSVFLPNRGGQPVAEAVVHKADFSSAVVDMTPVGTAKQVTRLKRARGI